MKSKPVWLGGKSVEVPLSASKEILLHASRTVIVENPNDTVTITVPRGIARVLFHAATERAFAEAGRLRAVREYTKATIMERHAIGLAERERQMRPQGESASEAVA